MRDNTAPRKHASWLTRHNPRLQLSLGRWQFTPSLLNIVLTLLLSLLFWHLCQWQLSRADFKTRLLQQHHIAAQLPAQSLLSLLPAAVLSGQESLPDSLRFRQVIVQGHFLPQVILLDNQVQDGQGGYQVFSPFETDQKQLLLVARGWIAQGMNRLKLPQLSPDDRPLTLQGSLAPPWGAPILLAPNDHTSASPLRVQRIDTRELALWLKKSLPDFVIRAESQTALDQRYGLQLRWPELSADQGPGKHQAYALQWFVFLLIVNALLIGLNLHRRPNDSNKNSDPLYAGENASGKASASKDPVTHNSVTDDHSLS